MMTKIQHFEKLAYGMGLNKGMFAHNGIDYISPVTRQLFKAYENNKLDAILVNNLLNSLQ